MSGRPAASGDARAELLEVYDVALPRVYGYLLSRCRQQSVAEDLTSETFLAAADAVRRDDPPSISSAWLIGVARHKLIDHWRRQGREERHLRTLPDPASGTDDPWNAHLNALDAKETLDRLRPQHRAALTLRYLDDLPVPEVAAVLDRTLHATEGLLVRARAAFRQAYPEGEARDA